MSQKKILYVSRDDGGCAFYRCHQPAKFLKRLGMFDTEVVFRNPSAAQLMSADLVIMQEMGSMSASNIGRFMVEQRIPFMTEFDDFVHHVSPNNKAGSAWNASTLYTHRAMELARAGIGIQVSTPWLAREYFPYNPLIYVMPNYLDREVWDQPRAKREGDKIRIGWAGGNAHGDDLKMISKVMHRIVKEGQGKIVFETMGMMPHELGGVFPMPNEPADPCVKCGYEGVHHQHPGEALNNYPLILASKGWDIALAPVISNSFGNAKSDLKVKEYSALGIPVVASRVTPYLEASTRGAPVAFADTYNEWYDAIMRLVRDQDLREKTSAQGREWAQGNWIQDRVRDVQDVYKEVIALAERTLGTKEGRQGIKASL